MSRYGRKGVDTVRARRLSTSSIDRTRASGETSFASSSSTKTATETTTASHRRDTRVFEKHSWGGRARAERTERERTRPRVYDAWVKEIKAKEDWKTDGSRAACVFVYRCRI